MPYWWANQNDTYAAEIAGGYLWTPRRRADGSRNPFYDSIRLVRPGDLLFAYANAAVRAVGVALSTCRPAAHPLPPPAVPPVAIPATESARSDVPPAPAATSSVPPTGESTEDRPGWLLDVAWLELNRPVFPARYMSILSPLLPAIHPPLTPEGRGLQGGRLLELPDRLARALLQLAGGTDPSRLINPDWQHHQLLFSFSPELPAADAASSAPPPADPPPEPATTPPEDATP